MFCALFDLLVCYVLVFVLVLLVVYLWVYCCFGLGYFCCVGVGALFYLVVFGCRLALCLIGVCYFYWFAYFVVVLCCMFCV